MGAAEAELGELAPGVSALDDSIQDDCSEPADSAARDSALAGCSAEADSVEACCWAGPLADDRSSPVVQRDDYSALAAWVAGDLAPADCLAEADWAEADSVAVCYWAEPLPGDHSSPVVQRVDCSESAGWVAGDSALADCSAEADSAVVDWVVAGCWAASELLLVGSPAGSRAD